MWVLRSTRASNQRVGTCRSWFRIIQAGAPTIRTRATTPSREGNHHTRPPFTQLGMPTPRTREVIQTLGIYPRHRIISFPGETFSRHSRTGILIKGIRHQIKPLRFRTYSNHRILHFHRDRRIWYLRSINNKASNKTSIQLQNPGRVSLRAMSIRHEGLSRPRSSRTLTQEREMSSIWRYRPLRRLAGTPLLVNLGG